MITLYGLHTLLAYIDIGDMWTEVYGMYPDYMLEQREFLRSIKKQMSV
jgi:hypothetical protein